MLLSIGTIRLHFLLFITFLMTVIIEADAQNKKPKFTEIKISGYFRNYFTYRNMQENYYSPDPLNPIGPITPRTLMINGLYRDQNNSTQANGYREPLMMIVFNGKPSANTSFDVDFLIDNQMTGQILNTKNKPLANPHPISVDSNAGKLDSPRRIQAARWLNLGGGIATKFGKFDFKAGGVLNINMTLSTLNFYQYRDDMFERYPWEWQTNSFKRYTAFYNDKNVIRDPRLGSASVQGITIKGTQMPFRTGFLFIYGKANNTNGFQSFLNNNNQDITGIQLNKKFSTHSFSLNYYQSKLVIRPQLFDKTFHNIAQEQVFSSEWNINFKGLNLTLEGGVGSVSNPIDSIKNWDPIIIAKANTTKDFLPIPLTFQYFHIGSNVVNPNSGILNSSNRTVQAQYGNLLIYNNSIFEGAIGEYGQMINNRQGVNLSGSLDVTNSFKVTAALSSQQELENKFNLITFQHRLNGFNRSQFVYYRNGVGPYGRQMNSWRRSWEKIGITDSSINYKKGFNLLDISVKLKTRLFNRELIFSNYINYNSVQDKIAPIALFSSKAFLRSFYEEFLIFYSIHQKISLVGLTGMERAVGNNRTTLANNSKAIDQTGFGYGIGLDYDISNTTGLYIRQRWYTFNDKNFVLDKFKGYDTTVELKIFF